MDTATIGRRNLAVIARELVRAGVKLIQLREPKDLPTRAFMRDARTILAVTRGTGSKLIVNDRVDVARAVGADGVHLGQDDMPGEAARESLPADRIIGVSVTTAAQARRAGKAGADYLGAGAIFATRSKGDAHVIGLAGLRGIRRVTPLPIIAIGGINADNAPSALRAGAQGIAVIAAVFGGGDVSENVAKLRVVLWRHHRPYA
jgi:thiamine-phosphate pyrophosphorylase